MPQPAGEIVRPGQVVGKDLVSRNLVRRPVREALHVAQVGQNDRVVHLVHPRRVNPRHLEPVAARRVAGLDEEHLHAVAHAEHQPVGQAARKQDVLRADRIADAGHLPPDEPLPEQRRVVIRSDALEHHLAHGIRRADNPALKRIGGHRNKAVGRTDQRLETGAAMHGPGIERIDPADVGHRDVRGKPLHLAGDLALEADDHGQRQNHHRHPEGHRPYGNAVHDPGAVSGRRTGRTAGDEKGEIHGCSILS